MPEWAEIQIWGTQSWELQWQLVISPRVLLRASICHHKHQLKYGNMMGTLSTANSMNFLYVVGGKKCYLKISIMQSPSHCTKQRWKVWLLKTQGDQLALHCGKNPRQSPTEQPLLLQTTFQRGSVALEQIREIQAWYMSSGNSRRSAWCKTRALNITYIVHNIRQLDQSTVSTEGLLTILKRFGCPQKCLNMIIHCMKTNCSIERFG